MSLPDEEANKNPAEEALQGESAESVTSDDAADANEQVDVVIDETPEGLLAKALEDAEKFRDMALRAEAEMQNMQRRTSREVENAHKYGLEKLVQNLLPVVDSLEKAVEISEQVAEGVDDPMAQGVTLCHKLLVDVLGKEGIEIIDPHGAPFDPQEHQAMSMVENPDMEPNSVCAVVQKGYKLNGRLVRAAMVMVTKAPAAADESAEKQG